MSRRLPPQAAPGALRLVFLTLSLSLAHPALAQLVVELPFQVGEPARVVYSKAWAETRPHRDLARLPGPPPAPSKPPRVETSAAAAVSDAAPAALTLNLAEVVASLLLPILDDSPLAHLPLKTFSPPSSLLPLSSFAGDSGSGGVVEATSWTGNVSQGPGYITVGGTARDDNGWGVTGLNLNATGMNFITITAQRDAGNGSDMLSLQFEDRSLRTSVFSLSSANFALGSPTQAQIVLGTWSGDFDFTQIVSWSVGGGGLGTNDFRMTLHNLELSASAIPEPGTTAALIGLAAIGAALYRRRRQ